MLGLFRRLRLSYMLYNFFHRKQLVYNEAHYKALGLNKKYYSSVSSKDFSSLKNERSVNDENLVKGKLLQSIGVKNLEEKNKTSVLAFHEQGFAVLKHFLIIQ